MAVFGDSKRDMLVMENAGLKKEIELLREMLATQKADIVSLREQLRWTQEALVAKEAPEAYRDRQDAEALADMPEMTTEQRAERKLQTQRTEIASQYISSMEGPLFKDADDMCSQLMGAVGIPLAESQSLHGNDES